MRNCISRLGAVDFISLMPLSPYLILRNKCIVDTSWCKYGSSIHGLFFFWNGRRQSTQISFWNLTKCSSCSNPAGGVCLWSMSERQLSTRKHTCIWVTVSKRLFDCIRNWRTLSNGAFASEKNSTLQCDLLHKNTRASMASVDAILEPSSSSSSPALSLISRSNVYILTVSSQWSCFYRVLIECLICSCLIR